MGSFVKIALSVSPPWGVPRADALIALSATVPKAGAFAAALQQDTPLLLTCQMICRFLEASGPGNVQVEETD